MAEHVLVASAGQLRELLKPIRDGLVSQVGIDTETSEVKEQRFTPYGTDTRVAGFSMSWGDDVDLYVPIRHVPYDWRRRPELMRADVKSRGAHWERVLREVEGVTPEGTWAPGMDPNVPLADAYQELQEAFNVPDVEWLAHSWPFDASMFDVDGLVLPWDRMEDTQALSVFTDPRPLDAWLDDGEGGGDWVHGGHGLKHLGETWLGIPADAQALLEEAKQALGAGSARLENYAMLPLRSALAPYGCMDTRLVLRLAAACRAREAFNMVEVRHLLALHQRERKLVVEMMRAGIPVEVATATERCALKEKEREAQWAKMQAATGGREVPIRNPQNLKAFLYSEMGLPRYRGKDDTRDATLARVRNLIVERDVLEAGSPITPAQAVELLDAVRDYRSVEKELTSFYRPLSARERVHPVLKPLAARTTRYSAEAPNVQQAKKPKKAKDPVVARANKEASVRHLFKPDPGFAFLPCDYSAQEMRVASHYTLAIPEAFAWRFSWRCTLKKRGDCKGKGAHGPDQVHVGWKDNYSTRPKVLGLAEGFLREGTAFDPHGKMVEYIARYGLDVDRDKAKTADFAILYGAGKFKVAETIDCSDDVGQKLLTIFWDEAYPELGRVRTFIQERLRRTGPQTRFSHQPYIKTLHGAPIYLDDGYKGLNYVIQRSCREILLKAEAAVQDFLVQEKAQDAYRIGWPVHDELVLVVAKDSKDQRIIKGVAEAMVRAGAASKVPMVVEPNWAEESWAVKEALPKDWGCDGVAAGLGVKLEELQK